MTDFLILIRNLVLATIIAWLGLEFAPSKPAEPEKGQPSSVLSSLVRG